ncbi:MAG: hypothetical protein D3924_14040 [Candidatus Electrothrix sp. AR4]|nr:hypothetical protein [Candidatus Electrothrix sp. AR4]
MFVSYFGWGLLFSRVLGINLSSLVSLFPIVWLGWAFSLVFFSLLHLFFPLNAYISGIFFTLGIVFLFSSSWKRYLSNILTLKNPSALSVLYIVCLLLISCWIASKSMNTPMAYDSGLYHFNSIRWLNEYPIIPGLGNLHGRLAFNQTFFVYVASLNFYPFFNHGYNLANSFLLLLVTAECLQCLVKYFSYIVQGRKISSEIIAAIFCLPTLLYIAVIRNLGTDLSSPTPDIASSILQIIIFLLFVRILTESLLGRKSNSYTRLFVILSATAVSIKLSNIFYVFIASLISVSLQIITPPVDLKKIPKKILPFFLFLSFILSLWMIRGILSSGCPLYPSTFMCIDTEWSVPLKKVQGMESIIYSWARQPRQPWNTVLGNWNWLNPWMERMLLKKIQFIYPLGITSILGCFSTFLFFLPGTVKNRKNYIMLFILLVPPIAGLLFWFFMAPDIRFAGALFFILPIAVSIPLLSTLKKMPNKIKHIAISFLFLFINSHFIH